MRIVVMSDSHGMSGNIAKIINSQPLAEVFLFLGDGIADVECHKSKLEPHQALYIVKGNCDLATNYPKEQILNLEGKRIFFTHGHEYNVKSSLMNIMYKAKQENIDILLYAHTHAPLNRYYDGMYVLNSGSASFSSEGYPTYATIDITDKGVHCNIIKIK